MGSLVVDKMLLNNLEITVPCYIVHPTLFFGSMRVKSALVILLIDPVIVLLSELPSFLTIERMHFYSSSKLRLS